MLLASIGYPAARPANPHFYAYGLGWFLQDYKGRLLAMHTGSLYGANAITAISLARHLHNDAITVLRLTHYPMLSKPASGTIESAVDRDRGINTWIHDSDVRLDRGGRGGHVLKGYSG